MDSAFPQTRLGVKRSVLAIEHKRRKRQPHVHPALLRLSAIISQYFTRDGRDLFLFSSPDHQSGN
jgi:hypothetical protein